MDNILSSANMLLEENLEIEELEQRLETLIVGVPVPAGSPAVSAGVCDATTCDDFTCGSTT